MRLIEWAATLFAAGMVSAGITVAAVLEARIRREERRERIAEKRAPTMPRMPLTSREAWIEACGSDPRSCVGCDLIIRPGARMWTRIHGSVVSYMHEACADANGEALVRPCG